MSCNSCEELRTNSPAFYQKGVTSGVCTSLQNDTGLSPSNGHNDCTDLGHANDCLIGDMATEVKAYNVCDWRKYARAFASNVHQVIKAIICAICGILARLKKLECEVNYLFTGAKFTMGETTSGDAYAVAGKGVSFINAKGADQHTAEVGLEYIAGGLMRGLGSYKFYTADFVEDDGKTCGNFDVGADMRITNARLGNDKWNENPYNVKGGELICEMRIRRSAYPQIKSIFTGYGQETGGGEYHVQLHPFAGGDWAWGQHGWCDEKTGEPSVSGYSAGHKVPDGWYYLQLRLTSAQHFSADNDGNQYSPYYFVGARMERDAIEC